VSQVFPFFSSSSSSIYGSLSRSAAVAGFCGQSVARYAWAPDRYTTRGKQQTYQKTKKPKEKKESRECCHRNRLFKTLSLPLAQQQQQTQTKRARK
jgi:hypothetical protein